MEPWSKRPSLPSNKANPTWHTTRTLISSFHDLARGSEGQTGHTVVSSSPRRACGNYCYRWPALNPTDVRAAGRCPVSDTRTGRLRRQEHRMLDLDLPSVHFSSATQHVSEPQSLVSGENNSNAFPRCLTGLTGSSKIDASAISLFVNYNVWYNFKYCLTVTVHFYSARCCVTQIPSHPALVAAPRGSQGQRVRWRAPFIQRGGRKVGTQLHDWFQVPILGHCDRFFPNPI